MYWTYLLLAGLLEIGWAVGLKYTQGFTKPGPTIWTLACMAASFYLITLALKGIPMGTAYAVWTGIGAAGTALVGIFFLGEPREIGRIICLVLIVSGTIGLKLFSSKAV